MKKIVTKVVFLLALCVFIYSGAHLGLIYYRYWKVNNDNKALVNKAVSKSKTAKKVKKKYTTQKVASIDANALKRTINFKTLKSINTDIIGWIYIPHTNVDYAVLKGKDNQTYLHHNYYKKYSFAGSIFMDQINQRDFSDDNTIIYGHNMKNGSMFATLKQYASQSYMDAHPYIYVYLPDGSLNVYKIFSTNVYKATSAMYSKNNTYHSYVQKILSTALAKEDVDQSAAPLLMCSTCSGANSENRNVVYGRLVETRN